MDRSITVALVLAAVGQILFVSQYVRRRWWAHFVGRALFTKSATLGLVLVVASYFRLNPGLPYELVVKTAAFWLVVPAIWWQFFALLRQSKTEQTGPKPYSDPDQPESWYWLEYRPSGHWAALEPPADSKWLLVRNDLELEWFPNITSAAQVVEDMVAMDTAVVAASKRQGKK